MKKGIIVFLVVVVLILIAVCVMQNKALNKRAEDLSSSSLTTKVGPFEAEQRLEFSKNVERLPEGFIKSSASMKSPVDADITVNAVSRDNVAVTGVWQEGKKTILVLEPTADKL